MSDGSSVVEIDHAVVRIDGRAILGPIDLTVRARERWVMLGPNGSGKTTLLSLAGARRQPSSGRVSVLGTTLGAGDVRELHGRISHSSHLLAERMPADLTAETVVLTGKGGTLSPWFGRYGHDDVARAQALLRHLGCEHLVGRRLSDASQGERQRVLLARALFAEPELMILDEPAAGLDLPGREALIASIDRAAGHDRAATIVATHHLEEIPPSTTHATLLRDGRAVASGPVADVLTPALLEQTFAIPVAVARRNGRWSAIAATTDATSG